MSVCRWLACPVEAAGVGGRLEERGSSAAEKPLGKLTSHNRSWVLSDFPMHEQENLYAGAARLCWVTCKWAGRSFVSVTWRQQGHNNRQARPETKQKTFIKMKYLNNFHLNYSHSAEADYYCPKLGLPLPHSSLSGLAKCQPINKEVGFQWQVPSWKTKR